ncbi:Mss4-like protein, partial [Schizophyllum fasciatum]
TTGSCLCGAVRIVYTGKPVTKGLCHCLDCRKISGTAFSTNLLFPSTAITLHSGTPRTYTTHGGSGQPITSFFCGACGTTLYRETPVFPGLTVVKAGVLDDARALDALARPALEIFARRRA